jgi:transcriptional regulator with XRE-family HTH domain
VTPTQCRAARTALGLSMRDLGKRAGLMGSAVKRYEDGEMLPSLSQRLIRGALESAGVEFITEDGSGAGVRLQRPFEGRAGRRA